MLNVSGHLLSTAEVESAILDNRSVAEVAAVSMPHAIKGEAICCFVVMKAGLLYGADVEANLKKISKLTAIQIIPYQSLLMTVREKIGPVATPDSIFSVSALPKTRSGKIMRRILAKIARNDKELGDLTTISDESVIEELISIRSTN